MSSVEQWAAFGLMVIMLAVVAFHYLRGDLDG